MAVVSVGLLSLNVGIISTVEHRHVFFHLGAVDVDPNQQSHLTVKLQFFEKLALTAPQVDHLKSEISPSLLIK